MEDKVQKLLQPRYEVVADYPHSCHTTNSVIEPDKNGFIAFTVHAPNHCGIPEAYPHLFRKLSWWERREESEMPGYVKNDKEVYRNYGIKYGHMVKVVEEEFNCLLNLHDLLPATQTDYLTFINKKKV